VAIIFGLSIVPITIAAGAGLDFARGLMVRARIAQALDAAGLAVGGASKSGMSQSQLQTLAQQYFNANYVEDHSFGTPASVSVVVAPDGKSATLSTSINVPTVLVKVGDLVGCTHCDTMAIPVTNTIVWGQTKLWVALVLDNTLSMCEPDSMPCSSDTSTSIKINALKTATHQLLTTLQGAASTAGDVRVALIPFSKDVNIGTSNASATWVDWTNWDAAPPNAGTLSSNLGAGSSCPWSTGSQGYQCQTGPTNGSSTTTTIPATCTINGTSRNGCVCPTSDNGSHNTGQAYHYYNGCYDSQPTTTTTTIWSCTGSTCSCGTRTSCTCSGSGSSKVCRQTQTTTGAPYTHTWYSNPHSTWTGCVEDRAQSYDAQNTTPSGTSTNFPAENLAPLYSGIPGCLPATVGTLSYDWTSLSTQVDAMKPSATTNQPIGLVWGWHALSTGAPLNAPTLPSDTQRYIILVSDGLNTQDRWYMNSDLSQNTSVDARMTQVCNNVKADNITIYTIFVDLNGTQGNSTVLQNCASDSSKYFDLTTTGSIITTLNAIAQDIVHLRVAR
jgi:hypothetical protein